MTPLNSYSADHRALVEAAAKAANLTDPIAFVAGGYVYGLVGNAIRGELVPPDGAAERCNRATTNLTEVSVEYNAQMTEYRKTRDEERKRK